MHEITNIGIGASNTRLRKQAESISDAVQEGSIYAVECWDQAAGCAHNFFLCEVHKHPDESIKKIAPSLHPVVVLRVVGGLCPK